MRMASNNKKVGIGPPGRWRPLPLAALTSLRSLDLFRVLLLYVGGSKARFLVGLLGGVLAEILHWWCLREKPELPQYAGSALYHWAVTVSMAIAGQTKGLWRPAVILVMFLSTGLAVLEFTLDVNSRPRPFKRF
jgi:hypothetical protein